MDPLPLIVSPDEVYTKQAEDIPMWYGYALIVLTWLLFLVTINSVFECWRYIIEPLKWSESTAKYFTTLESVFSTLDSAVLSLWCVYVVAWWWANASWLGLKLFRQSKGI